MKRVLQTAAVAAIALNALAGEQVEYLCAEDLATELRYNEELQRWEQEDNFRGGHRFLIRALGADAANAFGVFVFGRNAPPIALCKEGFADDGLVKCDGNQHFVFNRYDGRYQRSYEPGDTRIIAVGSCTRKV